MTFGKYDRYASAKTSGEFLLSAALLADDIKDLYDLATEGVDSHKYYYAILVVIIISICLQVTSLALAITLLVMRLPEPSNPESSRNTGPVAPMDIDDKSTSNSRENFPVSDGQEASPPAHMKKINDALTALTILVAIFHVVRNALDGNYPPDTGPSTSSPM